MISSKERAQLRAQANALETTLMVGKEGITDTLIEQTVMQLDARELIKGRVLETAFMTAREASDALCEATGADGIQTVGSKFVIYRYSEKKHQLEAQKAAAVKKAARKSTANPVRKGVQKRRATAKRLKEQREEYFHQAAVQAAIDRRKNVNE